MDAREQKRTWRRRRKREMQRQFLDAIQMMAASLQSGYSVENAVRASAKELEKLYPRDTFIVLEFQNMALQLDRNQSVESLLQDLGERSQVEDRQSFAEVFLTVKRTGGDLLHAIRNTVSCIRQSRRRLQRLRQRDRQDDGAEGDESDAVTDLAVCTRHHRSFCPVCMEI